MSKTIKVEMAPELREELRNRAYRALSEGGRVTVEPIELIYLLSEAEETERQAETRVLRALVKVLEPKTDSRMIDAIVGDVARELRGQPHETRAPR